MESTLIRFILRHSLRQQIGVVILTLVSFPFLYYSLDLPKTIINQAIGGKNLPKEVFGFPVDQVSYLMVLSGLFLLLVFVNGGFKYAINVYKGRLGERMLRRFRYELYVRILRFPLGHFRRVSQGELIPMITAEVEPLGGFIGDAIAQPIFQGGTLLTIVVFMFIQDPILGAAAISLYPIQGYIIPRLQRKVNRLGKERVKAVRKLAEQIGESVSGVQEIRANDNARWQLARFTAQLGVIYDIRFEIFKRKFFVKFLNNFINQLTPFFFYAIGGYLVIQGDLSFGALVAVLAAYKDLASPWKELLDYYQQKEDNRIKYEQIVEQFAPEGMLDEAMIAAEAETVAKLEGNLQTSGLTLIEEDGKAILESVSLTLPLDGLKLAVVGPEGQGKDQLAMILARLILPSSGQIQVGGRDLLVLPVSVTGRRLAYVGPNAYVFSSSLRDNLLFGVMHRPVVGVDYGGDDAAKAARRRREAELAGNSVDDPNADWTDRNEVGASDTAGLLQRLCRLLERVDLETDVYHLGLRGTVDPARRPDIAECLLDARRSLRERLATADLAHLVEAFDRGAYNSNASLAENLVFGTPIGHAFDLEKLTEHPYVIQVLDRAGLTDMLIDTGRKVAETMVELFADLPPDNPFFEQFSFISADDLPEFQALLGRVGRETPSAMKPDDRIRLLALPFKLINARHRLSLIDEALQHRIVEARGIFASNLPEDLKRGIEFFDPERYNAAASLQDNVLFGKLAYGQAQASVRVGQVVTEVLDRMGLRTIVLEVGLDFAVGIGGSRLTQAQRQKLAVARALLRRPDLLILNQSISALDGAAQGKLLTQVLEETDGRAVIWVLSRAQWAKKFQRVIVVKGGRVAEQGSYAELDRPGSALAELLKQD
ncbi:MAG: ATP-binding cassette domain-containing protein [Alphaproteobacteria bacterium]|nr:ATP-binding cassette domain-containing protein [Alphaproteobacteria bacterium]